MRSKFGMPTLVKNYCQSRATGRCVRFSPDGKRLGITIGREVKLLDAETGKELLKLDGYGPLAFSPDGKRLATGGDLTEGDKWQPLVKLWDAQTGQRLNTPREYRWKWKTWRSAQTAKY